MQRNEQRRVPTILVRQCEGHVFDHSVRGVRHRKSCDSLDPVRHLQFCLLPGHLSCSHARNSFGDDFIEFVFL